MHNDTERLFTLSEVAEILRVSPRTVQRIVAKGSLRCVSIGRARRVVVEEINRFLRDGGSINCQKK